MIDTRVISPVMTCAADDAGTVLDPGFGSAWNGECIRLERAALILRRLLLVKAAQEQVQLPEQVHRLVPEAALGLAHRVLASSLMIIRLRQRSLKRHSKPLAATLE